MESRTCLHCRETFLSNHGNRRYCPGKNCKQTKNNNKAKVTRDCILPVQNILIYKRGKLAYHWDNDPKEVVTVSADKIFTQWFDKMYHTHRKDDPETGELYIFCYEYGYCEKDGQVKIIKE